MIHWLVDDGVGFATLDRPERRNALDRATVDELLTILAAPEATAPEAGAPDAVRPVLVLTGAGSTFCSGFDLTTRDEGAAFKVRADALFDAMLRYPAPVVAALNGPAVGMGAVLAATCDLRIGGAGSWFEVPAARLGVVLDEAYLGRIRDRVGMPAAQLLFMASRRVDAARARELGLLHELVEDPLAEATAWARHIAGLSATSLAAHKAMLNGV